MTLDLIGMSVQTLGELFVAYTVLRVHNRVMREHDIDDKVVREMHFEQSLGILGIICIVVGFMLHGGSMLARLLAYTG